MGTDDLGRDVFERVLFGASLSLRYSVVAWLIALGLGLLIGTIAGYYSPSPIDKIATWIISLAYLTPFMVFLVTLLSVIGPGLANAYAILVIIAWAAAARQTRVAVRELRRASYVTASRSFGFSSKELFTYVIIPMVFRPALIASLAVLPEIIALDAGLSFFGLGAQPPVPSLGKIIAEGLNYISMAWWMSAFPVLVLATVCLVIRFISSSLQEIRW
jgi:peptide/nickel transport system permease protein